MHSAQIDDPKILDFETYGRHEEWVAAFKRFASRKYNIYGVPVDRSNLFLSFGQIHSQEAAQATYNKNKNLEQ